MKFTLRNIKEHKFRTFLILISIMLSVGLFFGSLSVSDALTELVMDNIKSFIGTAEISVSAGRGSQDGSIVMKPLGEVGHEVEYAIGVVEYQTSYHNADGKDEDVGLKGYRPEDLKVMNPVSLVESMGDEAFAGKAAYVGQSFAQREGLVLGDSIKLRFSDEDVKFFRIVGIAEDKGFFKKTQGFGEQSTAVIVPRETLSRFLGSPNLVNAVYVKTIDDMKVDEIVEKLKLVYKNESVYKMVTKSEIDAQIRPIRIPFMFMLILVVLISTFIIYTSFKVITLERLPMLGTFRSIGATKKMTDGIMLSEAVIYGLAGSGLGCWLGVSILKLIMGLIAGDLGVDRVDYPVANLLAALAFGLVLSVGSALVPIVKTSRIPVKEVLLNIIEGTRKKRSYIRYVVGVLLGVLSIVLPAALSKGPVAAVSGGLGIVLMIGALICFVPLVTDTLIRATEGVFGMIFGNVGLLAVKNMRGNKSTYDNVVLLTIGLASVMTISIMGSGIQQETMSEFNVQTYDIHAYAEGATKTTMQRILSIEGIQDSILYQEAWQKYRYKGEDEPFIRNVIGIDSERYLEFYDYDILNHDDDEEVIRSLLSGRKLILGTTLRDKYGLREGQTLTLETDSGMRDYEIIGFISAKRSSGLVGWTSMTNLKNDLKQSWGLRMAIRVLPGNDIDKVASAIEEKVKGLPWYMVETLESRKTAYLEENQKLIMILSAFSMATALIGSIGVMNNFLVSFLARRKALAVYASVGMSKAQKKMMILIEAASGGVIGAVLGILTSQLMIMRVGALLGKIDLNLNLELTLSAGLFGIAGAVLVCLISSLGVVRRSGKVSIVEELRYE